MRQEDIDSGVSADGTGRRPARGTVFLVGAGPGDPGLLTVKGLRLLGAADTIVHDALVNPAMLELRRPDARVFLVGERDRRHTLRQDEINQLLVEEARAGRTVVRLKGGDPFIFGRGGEEAEALAAAGVPFEVVPGVSAGVAAPAYAGIPLTHRGFTSELVFLTGHECESRPTPVDWSRYADCAATLVIFMGLDKLSEIVSELLAHGRPPSCPAAVIESGSTPAQRTISARLSDIVTKAAQSDVKPPAIIVVGEVVTLRDSLAWFQEHGERSRPCSDR